MTDLIGTLPTIADTIRVLRADKRFGQHFLTDPNILGRIVAAAGPLAETSVAEVGPGPGALTRALLASPAKKILAIELDPRFLAPLGMLAEISGERLEILAGDALEVDVTQKLAAPRAIIANLPYNVATPLLTGWLTQIAADAGAYRTLVLMFQKEVAERIVAVPDSEHYGRLAVLTQWLCHTVKAFDLPPGAFTPPPKVFSSVVVLTPREKSLFPAAFATVEKLLASAFGQRRKMLRGALKTLVADPILLLESAGIEGTRRAETLSLEEFGRLIAAYEEPSFK